MASKMEYSSSEGSADEEEILRNFDQEAKIIVQSETLPKKFSDRYLLVYNTYKKWREENKTLLSSSEENNLIVYFETLKVKLKPPTLWSIWSMLRKTLNLKDNININNFLKLKGIIKTNAKGYKPKKAFVLRWKQIVKFMDEAPNDTYLAMKVILIFGVCGCLRCEEITNIKVEDVEDLGNKYLVSIKYNKNDFAGQFIIGNLFYDIVKKYVTLRPSDQFSDRFFIKYQDGKCFRQPIGRHKIGEVPENIASYLQLPNAERYTGHCFRRTSATLLSDSGANMQMVKQLGKWRSDIIAQGYIENSAHSGDLIYDGVAQKATLTNNRLKPSTSGRMNNEYENDESNHNSNWSDSDEDFKPNEPVPIPSQVVKSVFTAPNKGQILVPVVNQHKPGIKNNCQNQSTVRSCKKRKNNEDSDSQNHNDTNTTLKKHHLKFENCTFNNCVFNVTSCDCNEGDNS